MKRWRKIITLLTLCAGMILTQSFMKDTGVNKQKLKTYTVKIGAQFNANEGGFLNLTTGEVVRLDKASKNQKDIDVIFAYGRKSNKNLMVPRSGRVKLFGGGTYKKQVSETWSNKTNGRFIDIRHGEKALEIYKKATNKKRLVEGYQEAEKLVKTFPHYNLYRDGPSMSIRKVEKGDIILFKSNSKNLYAIAKVADYKNGTRGFITLDFKVAVD